MNQAANWIPLFVLPAIAGVFILWFLYRGCAGLTHGASWLAWFGTLCAVGACIAVYAFRQPPRYFDDAPPNYVLSSFCALLFALLAGPFIVRLWRKWVEGNLTEEERQPGSRGWRAWMAGRYVIYAALLALLASQAWDIPVLFSLLLFIGALAIYPLLAAVGQMPAAVQAPAPAVRPISAEREKVMDLLAAGKITAEESAELLNALGATATMEAGRPAPLSSAQRLMLIGSALVLLGFFLPWFVIDPGQELGRAFSQLQNIMSPLLPNGTSASNFVGNLAASGEQLQAKMTIHISGTDIPHGLGWAVLILGLAAGLSPYLARGMDGATQHTVRLGTLAVGSFILFYLLSQSMRFVSFGIVLAIAGYVLEWIGMLRQPRAAR